MIRLSRVFLIQEIMSLSMGLSLFLLVCIFFTSVLSGVFGMAGGMILMGVLVWVLTVPQAMILHAVSQFFANSSRAFFLRQHIYTRGIAYYAAGVAVIFVLFSLITFVADERTVFLLLGASPFIAYALPKNLALDFTKPVHAFICGLILTVFQFVAGVGGPLLDSFFQNRTLTRHQTVATKAFSQSIAHITRIAYFTLIVGHEAGDWKEGLPLWLCLAAIPMALLGTHAGKALLERLSDHHFYRATQYILFAVGGIYLVKGLML